MSETVNTGKSNIRVCIATTFSDLQPSYSLVTVVLNQLHALLRFGYKPVLLVLPGFHDDDKVPQGVEVRKVVPQIILEPYAGRNLSKITQEKVIKDVEEVAVALLDNCADCDVVITHDWLLVDTYAPYAAAMHLLEGEESLKNVKWFHWIHSHPGKYESYPYPWNEQFAIPKGHKVVYLNNTDLVSVFERYQGTIDDVAVVHNPVDPRSFFQFKGLAEKIVNDTGVLDADVVQVYPVSTPRMVENKQIDKVILLFSKFKKLGKKVRLIVCNAHANAQNEKDSISRMLDYAKKCGLDDGDVVFTSLIDAPAWESGVPHDVVRDLFLLSNLFVFPTTSENCPLILLEAAATKNLLVLNDDFLPLREFFGGDALYFKFGSLRISTTYSDKDIYFEDMAKIILAELKRHRALSSFATLKQKFNYDYIFKNQMELLFFEGREHGV